MKIQRIMLSTEAADSGWRKMAQEGGLGVTALRF